MRKGTIGKLLGGGIFSIVLIFVFERRVDEALRIVGYDNNFVSYFPFIKNMYFPLASSNRLAGIDVAHFHMLDVALLLSITVWGIWLAAGIILLNRYDSSFQIGLARLSARYPGRRLYRFYFGWIFLLSSPIIMSIPLRTPLDNPELLFVLRYTPKLYFFIVALTYYACGGFLLSFSILFLIWKTFRQNRPSVVLQDAREAKEAGS